MRLDLAQQVDQADALGEVPVVQEQAPAGLVRVLVDVVEPGGVEARAATDDAVHLVALGQQQLGEVGPVPAR